MCETKRGYVLLLQGGDAEISGALAEGVLAGRAARLEEDQRRVVSAELDRQAIARDLREAVGNHKTAADYAVMRFDAEVEYGEPVYNPTRLQRFADKLLAVYGLIVYGVAAAYRAQDRVLGGRHKTAAIGG